MKKNYKNKSIKILTTSLLCGLAFTYVNVNAMKNNNSEDQQPQISQESNDNSNVTNNDKENNTIKRERKDIIKKIIEILDNEQEDNTKKIEDIRKELSEITDKKEKEDIKKEASEFLEKRINENKKIIEELEKYFKIIKERIKNKKFDVATKDIIYINQYIESNKQYLYYTSVEKIKEDIKLFNEKIMDGIKKEMNKNFKNVSHQLYMGNFDKATNIMKEIEKKIKKYEIYLNSEGDTELYEKTKELKEKIKYEKEKAIVIKQINDYFEEISTLCNSAVNSLQTDLLGSALQKITEIEKIIREQNKYVIGMITSIRNNIENWKEIIDDGYEIIKERIKRN